MAMPNPEAMATQLPWPEAAAASALRVRWHGHHHDASSAKNIIITFRIVFLLMNRCQWVVDVHRADALTLTTASN